MTILVELDPQSDASGGEWLVRNGQGGEILSRHRLKRRAMDRARTEARKRETTVREQMTTGRWKQGPSYGGR